jgi:hypothetical protein
MYSDLVLLDLGTPYVVVELGTAHNVCVLCLAGTAVLAVTRHLQASLELD